MNFRPRFALFLLSLGLLVACSDDVITDPVPQEPEPYPAPLVSAGTFGLDQLVDNLAASYLELNFGEYERILSTDFVFGVDPAEVDMLGMEEVDVSGDLASTLRMLAGEVGREPVLDPATGRPTGEFEDVPAVAALDVEFDPDPLNWEEGRWNEYGFTWRRVYRVSINVTHVESNRIDYVRGASVFYAVADHETGNWRLRAWEDQGADSAIVTRDYAAMSVASLKSWFLY